MTTPLTIECHLHFGRRSRGGRKELHIGKAAETPSGRVPRVARLMALALRFETLLQEGKVKDYAELARLGHVTRARITQIMNLSLLAPDIQEAMLFLPRTKLGHDPVHLWQLQPIVAALDWKKQRRL